MSPTSASNVPDQAAVSTNQTSAAPGNKVPAPDQAKSQPGFEAALATVGLLAASYLFQNKG